MCALTTAREIYAREERLEFLRILLGDQVGTYVSAIQALEPLDTSIEGLARCTSRIT